MNSSVVTNVKDNEKFQCTKAWHTSRNNQVSSFSNNNNNNDGKATH